MKSLSAVVGLALAFAVGSASAFPIAAPGTEGFAVIVSSTDNIRATYQGNSAQYNNDLLLNGRVIFNNQATPVGTTVDLGSFEIGSELIFQLRVNNTGNVFSTGPGERNPLSLTHARVQTEWQPNTTLVSFEDRLYGDFEYNDLSFSFTNTIGAPVPEPEQGALVLAGLAALYLVRRVKGRAGRA